LDILLVTNSLKLINEYEGKLPISNSIFMALNLSNNYEYIIIDEDNLILEKEEAEKLSNIREKVLILGKTNNKYNNISKDEFDIEDINIYYNKNKSNNEKNIDLFETIDNFVSNKETKDDYDKITKYNKKDRLLIYSYIPKDQYKKLIKTLPLRYKLEFLIKSKAR